MARLTRVDCYPPTGSPDRMWGLSPEGPGSPVHDAFLRAARPVVERYSESLPALGLEGPHTTLRFSIVEQVSSSDAVHVTVWERRHREQPETGFVTLNEAAARLDAGARARLVLDVLHAGLQQLAVARGWDPELLAACRDHVLAHDLGYTWSSAWKSSPGRRHQARATYRIDGRDGFGRARLEVRRRADEQPVLVTPEAIAFCTSAGLRRSATTLGWTGADRVSLVPYTGLVPAHTGGELLATAGADGWSASRDDFAGVRCPGEGLAEDPGAPAPRVIASLA